ncbi:hypothetical protein HAP48_0042675 [Bradyrhizobium septentrionale]|uniref:Uncharacterized protein n=1 Tax=Bradyrhizobium septentrionale TaxID=1404411 RepID=A0A973W3G4_9BRAD|nr:hypothetical protein [Bradyrhizobium septentrionale]UGY15163.1 hypothetical protein HAP48_0042675 [Bradyrhizobium septentrionale]
MSKVEVAVQPQPSDEPKLVGSVTFRGRFHFHREFGSVTERAFDRVRGYRQGMTVRTKCFPNTPRVITKVIVPELGARVYVLDGGKAFVPHDQIVDAWW